MDVLQVCHGKRSQSAKADNPHSQPEKAWLPYVCRYGDCANRDASEAAFATTEALHAHANVHHLNVNSNKGFITCVIKGGVNFGRHVLQFC